MGKWVRGALNLTFNLAKLDFDVSSHAETTKAQKAACLACTLKSPSTRRRMAQGSPRVIHKEHAQRQKQQQQTTIAMFHKQIARKEKNKKENTTCAGAKASKGRQ